MNFESPWVGAAYVLTRFTFLGRRLYLYVLVGVQAVPGVLLLLPLFVVYASIQSAIRTATTIHFQLIGTYEVVIVTYLTFALPFATWILVSYLGSIPVELEEAALVDGATRLQALRHVVIPLALPGMVVALVFSFLTGWNDVLFASVLTNPDTRTLAYQLEVFSSAQEGGALPLYGQLMGAAAISALPVVVLYYDLPAILDRRLDGWRCEGVARAGVTCIVQAACEWEERRGSLMAEKLRFGIIGCGVIGATHAKAISSIPDARLIAVADVVAENAQNLAEIYGVTPYTNAQEMLERERLDVVDICTPSGLHGELACQAMRTGHHVIVEKPMEISREAITQMLRVQRESGVKMAVISQHRFDPAAKQVYELAQQGAFGRLVLGNAQIPWWRSQQYYDSGAWRGTWELDGGGVLMNQGIHSVDLLQWLMGPVQTIYAHTATLAHRMQTEDVAVAVLRFANGALGTLAGTTGAYPGLGTRIEVYGDQGSAVIADDRLALLHLRTAGEEVSPYGAAAAQRAETEMSQADLPSAARDPAAISIASHIAQIADMVEAIRDDRPPLVDGEAGRRPVEIILGVYESARTHQEVTLP